MRHPEATGAHGGGQATRAAVHSRAVPSPLALRRRARLQRGGGHRGHGRARSRDWLEALGPAVRDPRRRQREQGRHRRPVEPLCDGERVRRAAQRGATAARASPCAAGCSTARGELRLHCDADCASSLASLPRMLELSRGAPTWSSARGSPRARSVGRRQPLRRRIVGPQLRAALPAAAARADHATSTAASSSGAPTPPPTPSTRARALDGLDVRRRDARDGPRARLPRPRDRDRRGPTARARGCRCCGCSCRWCASCSAARRHVRRERAGAARRRAELGRGRRAVREGADRRRDASRLARWRALARCRARSPGCCCAYGPRAACHRRRRLPRRSTRSSTSTGCAQAGEHVG